jgi:hypothetical protein
MKKTEAEQQAYAIAEWRTQMQRWICNFVADARGCKEIDIALDPEIAAEIFHESVSIKSLVSELVEQSKLTEVFYRIPDATRHERFLLPGRTAIISISDR